MIWPLARACPMASWRWLTTLASGLFLVVAPAASLVPRDGVAMVGTATVAWNCGELAVHLVGVHGGPRWAFGRAANNLATCPGEPTAGAFAPYLGWGSPSEGYHAAPPVCCLESSIHIGPLRFVDEDLGTFEAAFVDCVLICREGTIKGVLVRG